MTLSRLFDRMVLAGMGLVPRRIIWTVARRYVAGAELDDALERISALRSSGFGTIIDVLGESVASVDEAREAAAEYHRALAGLAGVDDECPVSVKPTHLGLSLDQALCRDLLAELCVAAAESGRQVRLEMEDAPTVDGTLAVFRELRFQHENLGCVLQSRLFRTAQDVMDLLTDGPGLNVRLVKGIYLEPPEIAWTRDEDISRSFVELSEELLAGGAFVGFATHDDALAERCAALVANGDARDRYEFQLLMGVRLPFAEELLRAGHPVRIYVPYGRDWYAYSMRRLAHNPEIARHVMRAALGLSS